MKLILLCASWCNGRLSSLNGEVVVAVIVYLNRRRMSDIEIVGGGGVEGQVRPLYKWGCADVIVAVQLGDAKTQAEALVVESQVVVVAK
jgi:hypothetical protein